MTMKFKFYDILSQLVPGFLVYGLIKITYPTPNTSPLIEIAFAFVLGYLINALGSTFEKVYYFTFGGKPSTNLLDGKSIKSVNFYEYKKIKNLLLSSTDEDDPTNDHLFRLAYSNTNESENERINNFNANYAFSRSLLTTFILSFFILLPQFYNEYLFYIITFLLILITWFRCKKYGYYFAREVLETYRKKET